MKTHLLALLLFFAVISVNGQAINSIQIIPSNPTSSDFVYAIVNSSMNTSMCWLTTSNISNAANFHSISGFHCSGLLQQICTRNDTFALGLLPQGYHSVDYSMYYNNLGFGQTECSTFQFSDTISTSFIVGPSSGNIPIDIHPQGEHHFCVGDSLELHADAQFNQTYQWIFNGAFIPNEASPTIIAKDSGYYQLRVYENSDSGTSDAILIHAHSLPHDILSQNNLTISTDYPSVNYAWYNAQNGLISGADSASMVVSQTGSYFVKLESAEGCLGGSDTLYVELINAVAIPDGPTERCEYDTLTLNANPSGSQYNYQWLDGPQLISGETDSILSVSSSGNYRCVVSIRQSVDTSLNVEVIVWPTTIPNLTFDGVTISSSQALFYQWYSVEQGIINGATNQTYVPVESGNYYVLVMDSNNCEATSNALNVELTGIPHRSLGQVVKTWLNEDLLQIELNEPHSGELLIYNLYGKQIMNRNFSGKTIGIDLSQYASATYVLVLNTNTGAQTATKIIRP
jgi:hypothetical protein